jgi:hypothetical protein
MTAKESSGILVWRLGSPWEAIVALLTLYAVQRSFEGSRITLQSNRSVSAKAAAVVEVFGRPVFFEKLLDYSEEKPVSA